MFWRQFLQHVGGKAAMKVAFPGLRLSTLSSGGIYIALVCRHVTMSSPAAFKADTKLQWPDWSPHLLSDWAAQFSLCARVGL